MVKVVPLLLVTMACITRCFAADTIIVHKDSRLDILSAKQAEINKSALRLTPNGQYKGYRLLVMVTNNRDQANAAKAAILQNFPAVRAYLSYLSPYFKVKVGNFTSREDADNFKTELTKVYDGDVYIVEDIIEYEPPVVADTTRTSI